jgi:hypothetical protein
MSWLNSDAYDKGFNAGKSDAQNGKKRNLLSFKAGLQSVFAFNNNVFQDTYIKGYKEGYRIGKTLEAADKKFNNKMKDKLHRSTEKNLEYNSSRAEIGPYDQNPKSVTKLENTTKETQNKIFLTLNKTGSMQRGIDGQIDLLEQMKDFLSKLSQQFDEVTKTQENFIRGLDSEGLDFKLLEKFEDYLEDNRNKIRSLIDGIENEEIPYTNRVIQHLEDTPR